MLPLQGNKHMPLARLLAIPQMLVSGSHIDPDIWNLNSNAHVKTTPDYLLPDSGKIVVKALIVCVRNILFQNQRFPTRESMSFLKGEIFFFLFFSQTCSDIAFLSAN